MEINFKRMATRKTKVALTAAALAAAGAAAGYYFYGSKDAKQHRKIAAKWATDMKNEVVTQAKKVQDIDRKQVLALVDKAAKTYRSVRTLDQQELARAAKELKDNWRELVREVGGGKQTTAKKTAKKAAKKAAAKKR